MGWNSGPSRFADRDKEIFKRREAGEKLRVIGESYGIGVERTRNIYDREKRHAARDVEKGQNNGTQEI